VEYDPIKKTAGRVFRRSVFLQRLFFAMQGILFLREWYVKRAIRNLDLKKRGEIEILDAGAGFGQYSYFCAKRFREAHILGLDIAPDFVAYGNRFFTKMGMNRIRFEQADITTLSYQNRFDLILAVDVLEHIADDEALLQCFFRALKTGGHLIVSTPTVYRKNPKDAGFVAEHFREGYSEEGIYHKFGKAGFRIGELVYAYGFWGDLSWRLGIRNTGRLFGKVFFGRLLAFFYFFLVFPFVFILMGMDFCRPNKQGTGFIIDALKSA